MVDKYETLAIFYFYLLQKRKIFYIDLSLNLIFYLCLIFSFLLTVKLVSPSFLIYQLSYQLFRGCSLSVFENLKLITSAFDTLFRHCCNCSRFEPFKDPSMLKVK